MLIVIVAAVDLESKKSGIRKGVVAGIVLGSIFLAAAIVLLIAVVVWRRQTRQGHKDSNEQPCELREIMVNCFNYYLWLRLKLSLHFRESEVQIGLTLKH